ncbi:MAG: putative 2OG-Fe(II) oxygenase [Betaproteobacteria bacterium]
MDHGIKSRLLKKYEAGQDVCLSQGENPVMDFYSPFGPMIAKVQSPPDLLARINAYADARISGDKGCELVLPREICAEGGESSLASHVAGMIRRYLAGMENARVSRVDFENFWIVSQYAGTPSPVHFHTGDLSGVLYLRVPQIDDGEEARTYISGRQAGYINFLIGGKQRFSKSLVSFKPQAGDFYIFPGWLLHVAEPFRGSGERRSLAFNAFVAVEE